MTSRAPWIEVVAALVVAVGELGGAIGMHVWFDGLPYDERPVPRGSTLTRYRLRPRPGSVAAPPYPPGAFGIGF